MKVFISSLITGMEDIRAATKSAIEALGHTAVMAENFGARPQSPQVACLDGLRQSSLVVLILGESYGAKQASGISATHEEYREAKGSRPVIAFVEEGVTRDSDEADFVREVQAWEGGLFRGGFRSPEQLKSLVTRAIHEWELSVAAAPLDGQEMLGRALAAFPDNRNDHRGRSGTALSVSIAAGPAQPILRPSEIEREAFSDSLMQAALFGATRLFTPSRSTAATMEGDALLIMQEDEGNLIRLDTQGGLLVTRALTRERHAPAVIEEEIAAGLSATMRYATWLLDQIDATQRLTHVAIAATLTGSDSVVWRTRAEQDASPNSYQMGWSQDEKRPVHLVPPQRPRSQLTLNPEPLVEDILTLLRRTWKS